MADQKWQVPRHTFIWLLLAQTFLLFPHMLRYPTLVLPLWFIASGWRIMIYRARWRHPSTLVKAVLIVFGVAVVILHGFPAFSLDTSVTVLIVAYLLKLIEMRSRRDVLIVIYLSYFMIVTWLLFNQTMLAGAYLLGGLLLVTTTLVTLYMDPNRGRWHFPLAFSAKAMAISVPVMLVGFIVFPRIDPFWSVPLPGGSQGVTGIGETMSPGNISNLAQSDALAFRAEFDNEIPARKDLYWRAIVLTDFDGKTWRPISESELKEPDPTDIIAHPDRASESYSVVLEPHHKRWLFTLAGTTSADTNVLFLRDYTIKSREPAFHKSAANFQYYPEARLGDQIYQYHRTRSLHLPDGFNPKTLALADELRSRAQTDEEYMALVQSHFLSQPFSYTLSPAPIGEHGIDDFLFSTQEGFCEYYAGAYVVLMRAGGIPARVVTGYQGGERNAYQNYLAIRQMDAHAWVEVWLDDRGWTRVDPTGFVAPDRIEFGSQQALQNEQDFLANSPLSPRRYKELAWLAKIQQRYDQLNYMWVTQVLGFESSHQENVLRRLLGDVSPMKIGLFIAGVFSAVSFLVFIVLYLKQRPEPLPPLERAYYKFVRKLSRRGLDKPVGEGPVAFAERVKDSYPDRRDIQAISDAYIDLAYRPQADADYQTKLKRLEQAIRAIKI